MKRVLLCIIVLFCIQGTVVFAQQKVALTANFKSFGVDKVTGSNGTTVEYGSESSFSGNLRLFDRHLWAFRLGVGVTNFNYNFSTGTNNYEAVREHLTAYLGVEKFFHVGSFEPYLGVYIPISFNAKDKVTNSLNQITEDFKQGNIAAGFAFTGGLNIKMFRVLRIGVAGDVGFSNFKNTVLEHLTTEPSAIKLKNLEITPEFVVGFAF
ncbi:MAG TPA: hypothetical protein PKH93_00815 [Chitinophagales bacterium]|nr:hypothetical protein [Chitinophagales bacterium]